MAKYNRTAKARMTKLFLLFLVILSFTACTPADGNFTLYRNSAIDANMRIHVASFDAADGAKYNNENCNVAGELFKNQPGVTVRYWCEKGRYAK